MNTKISEELPAEAQMRGLVPVTDPTLLKQLNSGSSNGLKPVNDPALLAELNGNAKNEKGIVSKAWDGVKSAVIGQKEFDNATSYEDWQWSQPYFGATPSGIKTAFAGMFGSDEDKLRSFQKHNPQHEIKADKFNNPYFIDKEQDNKVVYLDWPGLDAGDLVDFAGEAGTYAAGGLVTAPIKGTFKRAGATAGVEGGINAGAQKLAGRDEVDGGEVAMAAGLGGAVDFVSPFAGKLYKWAKDKLSGSDEALKVGAEIARKAGLESVDGQTVELLGKMRLGVDESITDDALIAEAKHGLKLTKGQATGDAGQQSIEEGLRNRTGLMSQFQKTDDLNQHAVETSLRDIRSRMYGGADDTLKPAITAETALEGLKSAESAAKDRYKQAFQQVGDLSVSKDSINSLNSRIASSLKSSNVRVSKRGTGEAMEALEIIGEAEQMAKLQNGFSLDDYKEHRGYIDNLYSPQMNKNDKRALTVIKNEYDDWFYTSVDDSLMSGNPDSIEKLKAARGMMTDYMNRFQSKEASKKVIKKIIDDDVTPEEFSNLLVGVNGYSKAGSANAVKAYGEAVGKDSEAFRALQANVFEKLIIGGANARTGEAAMKGYEGLVGTFNQAYNVKGRSMVKELFDNKTSNEIKNLMSSVNLLIKDKNVKNASGSGKLVAQIMSQHGNKFPLLSNLWNGVKDSIQFTNANRLPGRQRGQVARQVGLGAVPTAMDVNSNYRGDDR